MKLSCVRVRRVSADIVLDDDKDLKEGGEK